MDFLEASGLNLFINMPGKSHRGPLPPLTDYEREISDRLRECVQTIAGEIGPRNLHQFDALLEAASFIRDSFHALGYSPVSHPYSIEDCSVENIEVVIPGSDPAGEIAVVGAHYDTVFGSPGANDNGSGVAALIEIARLLSGKRFEKTIRLVAFVNEEPPHFQSSQMGSYVYARSAKDKEEKIVAMLALETIGYYSDEEGSQSYPPPLSLAYPSKGDFIGFVGNTSSGNLVRTCIASFRRHTMFPSEGLSAPSFIPGISWSDHWSFSEMGYPAIMVTDSAPYRYPHYHTAEDTPDKIDYDRTARVVAGLARVVEDLAVCV